MRGRRRRGSRGALLGVQARGEGGRREGGVCGPGSAEVEKGEEKTHSSMRAQRATRSFSSHTQIPVARSETRPSARVALSKGSERTRFSVRLVQDKLSIHADLRVGRE